MLYSTQIFQHNHIPLKPLSGGEDAAESLLKPPSGGVYSRRNSLTL